MIAAAFIMQAKSLTVQDHNGQLNNFRNALEPSRARLFQQKTISAIVGGYKSLERSFYVRLYILNDKESVFDKCGGAIWGRSWILTAAQCIYMKRRK